MSSDFSFKRDIKFVQWGPTALVNFFRSLFAGFVWFLIMTFSGGPLEETLPMLLLPLAYFIFLLPIGLICGWLAGLGIPFVGWGTILFSLMIVLGDPFTYILHKINPKLVPVEDFSFLNFRLIIFVLDPDKYA